METQKTFISERPALDVSIVICSRNRCDTLLELTRLLYAQKGLDRVTWELIIVDNGSSDGTRQGIEDWVADGHPNTRYFFEPTIGQAHAKNRGVVNSVGKLLVFTDDDVVPDDRWLASYFLSSRKFASLGLGGRLLPIFRPQPPNWYRAEIPFPYRFDFGDKPIALTAPPFGANMAYRREAFERYGLFRGDLGASADNPTGKGEDSEFGQRLLAAGETITYIPEALLYHPLDANTITKDFMHKWYYQYGRAEVVRESREPKGVRYFGVPRYLYRSLAANLIKRLFSADPITRYCSEMDSYRIRGVIAERRARQRVHNETTSSGKVVQN